MLYGINFKRSATSRIALTGVPEGLVAILEGLIHMANKLQKWITITSMNDSKHKDGSLHYKNLAVDVRVWNLDSVDRLAICRYFNAIPLYDAIDEGDHIHVEYDPK